MTDNRTIPLAELAGTRYARILTYPRTDTEQVNARIAELRGMGVSGIRFDGSSRIEGIPVLGKGCVGVVTQAVVEGELVALKIRRLDADRPSMVEEARLLRLANAVDVGPRLIGATRNFIVMKLFRGLPLFRWAENMHPGKTMVKSAMADLLGACFRLDAVGLDHGELSHAPRNVLVDKVGRPCIVDFESASTVRRVANVTSLLQYFLFGSISKSLHTSNMVASRRKIVKALGAYKREGSVESFQFVLRVLRLNESLL